MDYISTKEAAKRFKRSISSIKRLVAVAPDSSLRYEPNRTAHNRRLFISVEYLEGKLSGTRTAPDSHHQDTTVSILQKELDRKQDIINKLLHNQEQFLENERNFQVLLERSNQRADLLENHFDRNRKAKPTPEDEIIEEIIEEINDIVEEPTNVNSIEDFNSWLQSMSKPH
jgi:hypothetical protein